MSNLDWNGCGSEYNKLITSTLLFFISVGFLDS